MSKTKVTSFEAFRQWVEEFGHAYEKWNWGFADNKYVTMFGGVPNEENFWMWREFLRHYRMPAPIGKSVYTPPVWAGEIPAIPMHFLHVAESDQSMVAYTPDAAKGLRDVRVTIKPGKYLQKFYPDMSEEDVRRRANRHRDEYSTEDVAFAVTPEEVVRVYTTGPSSCMKHSAKAFPTQRHPAEVYGACESLVVAYLDRDSGISGRAVCDISSNPPKYSRVYGDDNLRSKLERMGFVPAGSGGLAGIRLPKLHDAWGRILMPYVDWNSFGYEDGDHIVIGENRSVKQLTLQNTSGFIQKEYNCPVCGTRGSSESLGFREYEGLYGRDEPVHGCGSCVTQHKIVDAYVDREGNTRTALASDMQRFNNVYVAQGLTPADCGLVEVGGRWYPPAELYQTVNSGRIPAAGNIFALMLDGNGEVTHFHVGDAFTYADYNLDQFRFVMYKQRIYLMLVGTPLPEGASDLGVVGVTARQAVANSADRNYDLIDGFVNILANGYSLASAQRILMRRIFVRDWAQPLYDASLHRDPDITFMFARENYDYTSTQDPVQTAVAA